MADATSRKLGTKDVARWQRLSGPGVRRSRASPTRSAAPHHQELDVALYLVNMLSMQGRKTPSGSPSSSAFRALADDTRREILQLLREGPRSSGDLADHFPSSWPTISRHLAVLREAGLVTSQRSGQEIRYELNTSVFEDLVHYLLAWMKPVPKAKGLRVRRAARQEG